MAKIAVVRTGGKQYLVHEGDVLKVEKLPVKDGAVSFDDVLLVAEGDGSAIELGQPNVKVAVGATITRQGRAAKILVVHYKAKIRYHKKNGHRQPFTEVKIGQIA